MTALLGYAGAAAVLGLLAFCSSGIGRVLVLGGLAGSATRALVGEYFVGLLAYSIVFAVAAHLMLGSTLAVVVLVAYACGGLAGLGLKGREQPFHMRKRLAIALGLACSFLISGLTPVNPGALDPTVYAYMETALFQSDWLSTNLGQFAESDWLIGTAADGVVSRAPELVLLWPAAVFGWGLNARSIAGAATWLALPALGFFVDTLHGRAPLLARLVMGVGALGVFNEVAVLVDGQINQTFALAVMLGAVWACRWITRQRVRCLILTLSGAAISAGYPEFLPAVPLYLLCCALQRGRIRTNLAEYTAGLSVGVALVQLTTRLGNARYVLGQVDQGPTWWPLASTPHGLADMWLSIVFQRWPSPIVGLVLAPAAVYAWHLVRQAPCRGPDGSTRLRTLVTCGMLLVLAGLWSWLALRSTNPNYATFKIGGWVGPGLFLSGLAMATSARPLVVRSWTTLLVVLAVGRCLGLVMDAAPKVLLYAGVEPGASAWTIENAHPCTVRVTSAETRVVMTLLAESGGPARGCHLVLDAAVRP